MSTSAVLLSTTQNAGPARALRVLTLTPFYPSVGRTGEGGFVAEVLPHLQRLGIAGEVIAARPWYRGRVQAAAAIPVAWKHYISVPANVGLPASGHFLAAHLIGTIGKAHRIRPFDLIHAHATLPCGHAAAHLSRWLGIPFVVSVHGLDVFSERQSGHMVGRWCRRVSERVYRRARAVICISEKVREYIGDSSVRSAVIYNGVDTELFYSDAEQASPLVVLSVGNLIPIKGHACLLRAFAGLPPSTNFELEIIGEGPERGRLARLAASLGISSRVRFLGTQSREAVARAMRRCALFALPSRYEGLGCVYLEAMACGKPVIACEGQGIGEIIKHGVNGMLVPPEAEGAVSDSIRTLLQNKDFRLRLGNAALSTIWHRHSLQHQAEQLANLYRECLA